MSTQIIEIDPKRKYVLECDIALTISQIQQIKDAWEKFIKDPNMHLIVFDAGLTIRKIEI